MNVEGQLSNSALFLIAAGGLLLLFLVVYRRRISKLEKELDHLTLRYQQYVAASSPKVNDMFAACPFPCCIIDRHGLLVSANSLFHGLVYPAKVRSVQEFDKLTLASLVKALKPQGLYNDVITIRDTENDQMRQFTVVSWPLRSPQVPIGRIITLHEQTNILRRKANQAEFERQLISSLSALSAELKYSLEHNLHDVAHVQALNNELLNISEYLLSLHEPLREVKASNVGDLVQVVKGVVEEVRSVAKKFGHSLILTLPHSNGVKVEERSFHLALSTLLVGISEYSKAGSIRIHIDKHQTTSILSVSAEDLILSEKEVSTIFSFGTTSSRDSISRTFHLRMAIARELVSKQSIKLSVHSTEETGTAFMFTLPRTHQD